MGLALRGGSNMRFPSWYWAIIFKRHYCRSLGLGSWMDTHGYSHYACTYLPLRDMVFLARWRNGWQRLLGLRLRIAFKLRNFVGEGGWRASLAEIGVHERESAQKKDRITMPCENINRCESRNQLTLPLPVWLEDQVSNMWSKLISKVFGCVLKAGALNLGANIRPRELLLMWRFCLYETWQTTTFRNSSIVKETQMIQSNVWHPSYNFHHEVCLPVSLKLSQSGLMPLRWNWFIHLHHNNGWALTAHHADDRYTHLLLWFCLGLWGSVLTI